MKKIAFLTLILSLGITISCKKDREVSTKISGQLKTNGLESPILMSNELPQPEVILYERIDQTGYTGSGYQELTRTTVNSNGYFNFDVDLKKNELYFIGVVKLDTSIYWEIDHYAWWNMAYNNDINVISTGEDNLINLYISAKSWIRPRFINSNNDPNNQDLFLYYEGPGPVSTDVLLTSISEIQQFLPLQGSVDTLAPWIHKTWSGKYGTGYNDGVYQNHHYVEGKITRNGITRDTNIFYYVPPFDTTIVEIRY